MSLISDTLREASELRIPVFGDEVQPRSRVAALENFLLLSAYVQGNLSQERLTLYDDLHDAERRWNLVMGWEIHLETRTLKGVEAAKAIIHPALYRELEDLRWKVKRLTEEIDRIERDATKASRAYSLISGT